MAAKLFGFTREMSGHFMNKVGHIQTQSRNEMNQILAQAETQRLDDKQREELLTQMKIKSDQTNAEREKMQTKINQKREQMCTEKKLKTENVGGK